jgi:hypothetical protein
MATTSVTARPASWSLCPPSGTCYFAPHICSSLPWRLRFTRASHEIANGEIEADEHHERDKPAEMTGADLDIRTRIPIRGRKFLTPRD